MAVGSCGLLRIFQKSRHNHDDFRLSAAHRTNSFASDHTTPADLCLKTSRIFLFTAVFQKNVWHFRVVRRCAYPTHIHIKTTLSRDRSEERRVGKECIAS